MTSTEGAPAGDSELDLVNRKAWSSKRVLREFAYGEGVSRSAWWSDRGEQAAFLWIAGRVRGAAALDVGVGGGRTVPIMRLVTDEYVAVDYTAEMVDLCRLSWPDVDVRLADARNLREFASDRFGFVVFSFNGIDALDHVDRLGALRELHRVLTPGGLLMFSTHNRDGPVFGSTPWRRPPSPEAASWSLRYRTLRWLGGLILNPCHLPRSLVIGVTRDASPQMNRSGLLDLPPPTTSTCCCTSRLYATRSKSSNK